MVKELTTDEEHEAVESYVRESLKKTDVDRMNLDREKTGVFTGSYAINPADNEEIPIWVADYILLSYGTGAIMAVPAHDDRDREFARKFDLPIKEVIAPDFGIPLLNAVDVTGPVVIGYDPKTKRFMSLVNKRNNMRWLVAGGLEQGESYRDAALRELAEEAGFRKVQKLIQLGGPNYSYFYNPNKDSNRRSFSYMFMAIINEEDAEAQEQESHEQYEVVWSDLDAIQTDFEKESAGREHWIDGLDRVRGAVKAHEAKQEYQSSVFIDEGVLFESGQYTGLTSTEAREKIVADLATKGVATEKVNYKMRDWSVSRQRYWGAPIPIVYCPKCGPVLVPDEQLPVVLPELDDFQPSGDGRSALARATDWLKTTCPTCGGEAERETDTLDTYICSSWYMYRYFDPFNTEKIFDTEIVNKWAPIDFYNGGDHATAHLLYARFVARFFHKLGLTIAEEPFKHMLFNGKVTASDGSAFSKSKGNGVDPLEIIGSGYGADALRMYLMFAAPLEIGARWDPQGVPGCFRFLTRLWNLVQEYAAADSGDIDEKLQRDIRRTTHTMIKKMTEDIEENRYNTAISAAMGAMNDLYRYKTEELKQGDVWSEALESSIAGIAPFAPHIADELWQQLGHQTSVQKDSWPEWNEEYIKTDTLTIAVQVNGKLRGTVEVSADSDQAAVDTAARTLESVKKALDGREPKKVIYVREKLINLVV